MPANGKATSLTLETSLSSDIGRMTQHDAVSGRGSRGHAVGFDVRLLTLNLNHSDPSAITFMRVSCEGSPAPAMELDWTPHPSLH